MSAKYRSGPKFISNHVCNLRSSTFLGCAAVRRSAPRARPRLSRVSCALVARATPSPSLTTRPLTCCVCGPGHFPLAEPQHAERVGCKPCCKFAERCAERPAPRVLDARTSGYPCAAAAGAGWPGPPRRLGLRQARVDSGGHECGKVVARAQCHRGPTEVRMAASTHCFYYCHPVAN